MVIIYVTVLIATSYKENKHIIIQHGRQNNVVVITYVMVLIAISYKENKTCGGGKKGGVSKIYSSKSAMK